VNNGSPFSPAALREVKRRWRRLRKDASDAVADRFLLAVQESAELLQQFPGTGTLCGRRTPHRPELRRFPVTLPFGNWLIIYTVSPDGIQILRVLHGAQNWQRLFP
jgi:toxin ParE1/3/4